MRSLKEITNELRKLMESMRFSPIDAYMQDRINTCLRKLDVFCSAHVNLVTEKLIVTPDKAFVRDATCEGCGATSQFVLGFRDLPGIGGEMMVCPECGAPIYVRK